jgi:hypothetical protein
LGTHRLQNGFFCHFVLPNSALNTKLLKINIGTNVAVDIFVVLLHHKKEDSEYGSKLERKHAQHGELQ